MAVVRPERIAVLPMLVVAVALLRVAPVPALGALALAATVVALFLAGRFAVTRNEQALLGVGALSLGILLPRALAPDPLPPGTISDGMYALGMAAQLSGVVRLFVRSPVGGAPVTSAIGLVALAAAGRASTPFGYAAFVALFLVTSAAAVSMGDPGRPRAWRLGPRHAIGALAIVLAGAGMVAAAAEVLPPLHGRMLARLMHVWKPRTGFTEQLSLGDMRGMATSSELVARVRGAPVDHLRGVVFRRYVAGRWEAHDTAPREVLETRIAPPLGSEVVELELPGRLPVYPVPLGATDLWASSSVLEVERQGVLRVSPGHRAKRIAFAIDPDVRAPGGANDAVEGMDRQVPVRIRAPLEAVLARWGALGRPPEEVVAIVRDRLLADYGYSLEFHRDRRVDPVLEFLGEERRGHCEYFASAAALLARAAGIPARVVGGYRVVERSPLDDYAIVRERDAHAWAEVWIDGRWETLDATPGGPIAAVPVTPWATAVADWLSTSWEKVDDWIARRTQLELSGVLVALLIAFVVYRVWRARGPRDAVAARRDAPLPGYVRLARALEKAGVPPRAPTEPIEVYARRIAEVPLDEAAAREASQALADYAALRYGAPRDEAAILERLAAAAAVVERRRLPRAARPSG